MPVAATIHPEVGVLPELMRTNGRWGHAGKYLVGGPLARQAVAVAHEETPRAVLVMFVVVVVVVVVIIVVTKVYVRARSSKWQKKCSRKL